MMIADAEFFKRGDRVIGRRDIAEWTELDLVQRGRGRRIGVDAQPRTEFRIELDFETFSIRPLAKRADL